MNYATRTITVVDLRDLPQGREFLKYLTVPLVRAAGHDAIRPTASIFHPNDIRTAINYAKARETYQELLLALESLSTPEGSKVLISI